MLFKKGMYPMYGENVKSVCEINSVQSLETVK